MAGGLIRVEKLLLRMQHRLRWVLACWLIDHDHLPPSDNSPNVSSLGHARTASPVRRAPAKSVGLRECTACRRHGHAREFNETPALCPFVSRAAAGEPTPLQ